MPDSSYAFSGSHDFWGNFQNKKWENICQPNREVVGKVTHLSNKAGHKLYQKTIVNA